MDERRAYLKDLAARSARRWSSAPLPHCFSGEARIETRNTTYRLRDGVCFDVARREGAGLGSSHPSEFVGMRVVGWLLREAPTSGITHEWQPGAYAVLWRPRQPLEAHSAVALTSATHAFRPGVRATVPPPLPRPSTPPLLPLPIPRSTLLPQPVTPPSWVPPPPLSTTRFHMGDSMRPLPPAPETPTPVRRSSIPPPLPPTARALHPLPPRLPAHG